MISHGGDVTNVQVGAATIEQSGVEKVTSAQLYSQIKTLTSEMNQAASEGSFVNPDDSP